MSNNRKAEAESSVRPISGRIGLAEFVENVGKERGLDADSRIGDADFCVPRQFNEMDSDASGFWCELYGVRKEIPHHLLESVCVAGNGSADRSHRDINLYALRVARRLHCFD